MRCHLAAAAWRTVTGVTRDDRRLRLWSLVTGVYLVIWGVTRLM